MIVLSSGRMALGQTHEIGLTLGGLFPQDRETIPDRVRLNGGTAWQGNYGHQLIDGALKLYGEVHFLGNFQRRVESTNGASTRDVATIYLTPGVRLKFLPTRSVTPYVAAGVGVAFYQQSLLQMNGQPNPASRDIHRSAFDFGAGVDTGLWRWIGLRGEIRDFYSGSPAYNLPDLPAWQHNVVAGGGFVLKWGN
jgi:opacity protein-like surface antigen